MATKKSTKEKIEEAKEKTRKVQEKLDKLKAEEKALIAKYNEQERKARTKRLIEIGAIVESLIGLELETETHKNLLRNLLSQNLQGIDNMTFADYYKEKLNENDI